jgi:hypothetical protein
MYVSPNDDECNWLINSSRASPSKHIYIPENLYATHVSKHIYRLIINEEPKGGYATHRLSIGGVSPLTYSLQLPELDSPNSNNVVGFCTLIGKI